MPIVNSQRRKLYTFRSGIAGLEKTHDRLADRVRGDQKVVVVGAAYDE